MSSIYTILTADKDTWMNVVKWMLLIPEPRSSRWWSESELTTEKPPAWIENNKTPSFDVIQTDAEQAKP